MNKRIHIEREGDGQVVVIGNLPVNAGSDPQGVTDFSEMQVGAVVGMRYCFRVE